MTGFEEERRKRPSDYSNEDYISKRGNYGKPLLKLLVPNFIAGKLIGKGGTTLSEIKSKFSASVQVSSNNEFFPGTDERIVTIATEKEMLKDFLSYLIDTIQVDKECEKGPLNSGNLDVKIVVTNVGAGLVIGKGGTTIKSIQEESRAKVYLSKRDDGKAESERVVVVSGSNEQRIKACCQIIENMSSEPEKMCTSNIRYGASALNTNSLSFSKNMFNNLPSETPSFLYNSASNGQRQAIGIPRAENSFNLSRAENSFNLSRGENSFNLSRAENNFSLPRAENSFNLSRAENNFSIPRAENFSLPSYEPSYEPRSHVVFYGQMEIPDDIVGAILGKQGQTIKEIIQASGAKIKFSAKDEYAPGTTDRILTIRGNINQITSAYKLVDQKVAQVEHDINTGVFTRR